MAPHKVLCHRWMRWSDKGVFAWIMAGKLKDRRRVVTRYDRCPKVFLSAIELAVTVAYWP